MIVLILLILLFTTIFLTFMPPKFKWQKKLDEWEKK
jgi:hypothetical protein